MLNKGPPIVEAVVVLDDILRRMSSSSSCTSTCPGVDPSSIDLNVEHNVLTVNAERTPTYGEDVELQVAERPRGVFSRQLFLGDMLDTDRIEASYDAGVLTLRIPIAQKAKPRKIEITSSDAPKKIDT